MTKANDRRVKVSLERTRLALKAEQRQLDDQRRQLYGERQAAILALREACGAYGDNAWTDDLPLDRIIRDHLLAPLAREMAEVRSYTRGLLARTSRAEQRLTRTVTAQPAPPAPAPPRPTPLRPTPVPEPVHRVLVVTSELRGERGYRANCVCSWVSPWISSEATAIVAGQRHQDDQQARREAR